MSTIIKTLERIINWRQTYYPEEAYFSSGLTLQQIEKLTQDFPFKLPWEVSELYQYYYGTKGGGSLAPSFCSFHSLEQALEDSRFLIFSEVNRGLPLFYGGGKECYYVLCAQEETNFSPVYVRFIGETPIIYGSSLTNLMLTVAECYETGAYYVYFDEESGYWELEKDLEKIELIFQKYNPEQINTWREIWKDE